MRKYVTKDHVFGVPSMHARGDTHGSWQPSTVHLGAINSAPWLGFPVYVLTNRKYINGGVSILLLVSAVYLEYGSVEVVRG